MTTTRLSSAQRRARTYAARTAKGDKSVSVWFTPAYHKLLLRLCKREGVTQEQLIASALDWLDSYN